MLKIVTVPQTLAYNIVTDCCDDVENDYMTKIVADVDGLRIYTDEETYVYIQKDELNLFIKILETIRDS